MSFGYGNNGGGFTSYGSQIPPQYGNGGYGMPQQQQQPAYGQQGYSRFGQPGGFVPRGGVPPQGGMPPQGGLDMRTLLAEHEQMKKDIMILHQRLAKLEEKSLMEGRAGGQRHQSSQQQFQRPEYQKTTSYGYTPPSEQEDSGSRFASERPRQQQQQSQPVVPSFETTKVEEPVVAPQKTETKVKEKAMKVEVKPAIGKLFRENKKINWDELTDKLVGVYNSSEEGSVVLTENLKLIGESLDMSVDGEEGVRAAGFITDAIVNNIVYEIPGSLLSTGLLTDPQTFHREAIHLIKEIDDPEIALFLMGLDKTITDHLSDYTYVNYGFTFDSYFEDYQDIIETISDDFNIIRSKAVKEIDEFVDILICRAIREEVNGHEEFEDGEMIPLLSSTVSVYTDSDSHVIGLSKIRETLTPVKVTGYVAEMCAIANEKFTELNLGEKVTYFHISTKDRRVYRVLINAKGEAFIRSVA